MNSNFNISNMVISNSTNSNGSRKKSQPVVNESKQQFQQLFAENNKNNEIEMKKTVATKALVNNKLNEAELMAMVENAKTNNPNKLKILKQETKKDSNQSKKDDAETKPEPGMLQKQIVNGQLPENNLSATKLNNHFVDRTLIEQPFDGNTCNADELASMFNAHNQLLSNNLQQILLPSPRSNIFQQSLVELIERHVQQLLANDVAAKGENGGQVILKFSNASLSGTNLILTKIAGGWNLKATTPDYEISELLRRSSSNLVARFAKKDFGFIEVETSTDRYR